MFHLQDNTRRCLERLTIAATKNSQAAKEAQQQHSKHSTAEDKQLEVNSVRRELEDCRHPGRHPIGAYRLVPTAITNDVCQKGQCWR